MEDSAWPYEAKLDAYLEAARTHYAPSLEQRTERSLLTLLGVFQAALGAPRRREVVLWQRVDFPERLPAPVHAGAAGPREGPGHVDARRARSARRLGEPPAPQRGLVPARLVASRSVRTTSRRAGIGLRRGSGDSHAVPPIRPPSSGHSPLNVPQVHSNPGTTHACTIQMSVSSVLRPPRARTPGASTPRHRSRRHRLRQRPPLALCWCQWSFGPAKPRGGRRGGTRGSSGRRSWSRAWCRRTAARTGARDRTFATSAMFV